MTIEECEKKYAESAVNIGHKVFMIELIQGEIKTLLQECHKLAEEKNKLLKEKAEKPAE